MKTPIQRILVPLDPSEYTAAATHRACEIAKAHGAQVTGLAVLDTPGIRSKVAPADTILWTLVNDQVMDQTAEARAKLKEMTENFAETCCSLGVEHTESELEGVPAELILDVSALYDLVVMGLRTYYHFETQKGPGKSLSEVLDHTATPILAVPTLLPAKPIERVLIAYDGSLPASRALRDFTAFAEPYSFEITLMTAHKDDKHAEEVLQRGSTYLRSHSLNDFSALRLKSASIPDHTLKNTDMVVAGIHAKRRFRDLVVGSFTKDLIDRGDIAMFLSH